MEQEELKKTISENIALFRKHTGLTQAELADKINYSDKAVSKWERGDGIPDVVVLCRMAEIFGVTLDDFVTQPKPVKVIKKATSKLIILLLAVGIAWLVATLFNVFLAIFFSQFKYGWMAYIYAIPVSAIIIIVFSAIWKKNVQVFLGVSLLIWSTILSVYLSIMFIPKAAFLFVLGAPLQVLAILWFFRPSVRKNNLR